MDSFFKRLIICWLTMYISRCHSGISLLFRVRPVKQISRCNVIVNAKLYNMFHLANKLRPKRSIQELKWNKSCSPADSRLPRKDSRGTSRIFPLQACIFAIHSKY